MKSVRIAPTRITSEETKSSGTAHLLHLLEDLCESVEHHLLLFLVVVIRILVCLMFTLALVI